MSIKICPHCTTEKTLDEFGMNRYEKDGKQRWCKVCYRARAKELKWGSGRNIEKYDEPFRTCRHCDESKPLDQFYNFKAGKNGKMGHCKVCDGEKRELRNMGIFATKLPTQVEIDKARANEAYMKNKNELRRRAEDPVYHLTVKYRQRIHDLLKGRNKSARSLELLGCSVEFLKGWIESQFTEGMTWENRREWHLDHTRPCSSYNLDKKADQQDCFKWINLCPLWAHDNLTKHDKVNWGEITAHRQKAIEYYTLKYNEARRRNDQTPVGGF